MGGGTAVSTYKRKLIEVALPLADINRESVKQKTGRPKTGYPTTLHKYWAQRSIATVRAAIWSSLVDDPSSHPDKFPTIDLQKKERLRRFDILRRLILWESTTNVALWAEARKIAEEDCGGALPPFVDPFAGSGAIPLEALRLGLSAHSSDLNPLAVTIQHLLIEWPQRFAYAPAVHPRNTGKLASTTPFGNLAADVRAYAEDINSESKHLIGAYYPPVKDAHGKDVEPGVFMWARTVPCPNPACGAQTPIVKNWRLSVRTGAHVQPIVDRTTKTIQFAVHMDGQVPAPSFNGRKGGACLVCATPIDFKWVRSQGVAGNMKSRLMAIAAGDGYSWVFHQATREQEEVALNVPDAAWSPRGDISTNTRAFATPLYGMTTWASLYTPRQLLALTTLHDVAKSKQSVIEQDAILSGLAQNSAELAGGGNGARAYAQLVRSYVHMTISNLADWSCNLIGWAPEIPAMGHLFARQAVVMNWNYAEGSVFGKGGANFLQKLERTVEVIERTPVTKTGSARQADATRIKWNSKDRPLVITDPPYYDNIPYSELADFFYVWMREALRDIDPETFATLSCPKSEELIMARDRHDGDEAKARQFFEDGLTQALHHLRAISDPELPMSIYYAYNDTDESDDAAGNKEVGSSGWETILQSIVDAGLQIVMTYPLRSEAVGRAISTNASALAACILLVCRSRPDKAPVGTRGDFTRGLEVELSEAIDRLKDGDLGALDLSQAAIGPGMSVFTRYSKVLEPDGRKMTMRTALDLINKSVSDVAGKGDAMFDKQTRWCVRWFEEKGLEEGAYGDAQMLANANGLNIPELERSGVINSKGGKVQLLVGDKLPADWDPRLDSRITSWEVLHQLIACLLPKGNPLGRLSGGSEEEALILASALSPALLEQAKELSYRMFDICRVRGWNQEALAYNAIGQSWADLRGAAGNTNAQMEFDLGGK
jgi:putative DNA methylase